MSAKTGKRPLRSLSAHEKLEAIRRVHDGESKASVARDIGVPESTLRGWCKNENKISYLSRQSSPETDESNTAINVAIASSAEPKEKRCKIESSPRIQPFNLSLKPTAHIYTPTNSESLYTPLDYTKNDIDVCTPKTPQNLSIKNETPKSTASQINEKEKNRAELARISVELGLNRPEMFTSNTGSSANGTNLTDFSANLNLLSHHWNSILMQQQLMQPNGQQQNKKVTSTTDSAVLQQSVKSVQSNLKPPKEQQSVDDYIKCWLKTQEALLTSRPRTSPTATSTPQPTSTNPVNGGMANPYQSSWFWKWYKAETAYNTQTAAMPVAAEKPAILYQQLTKKEPEAAENLTTNTKARTVLDNILINNNNICTDYREDKQPEVVQDPKEAIEHGEKFLRWLESCSNPSITAMQIMQFKTLLKNVKSGAERKNGDVNKTKVKRK